MERVTYPGIDNPIFVDDLLAADQAVLTAAATLTDLRAPDFAIINGLDFDGSTNYGAGVVWILGQFYFCAGCTTGQFLSGTAVPQLSEGFDDGNSRNIYSSFLATASNAGGAGFSPQFAGSMDTYRAGAKRLMLAVNALQVVAAALGTAAYLNVGSSSGTVAAGDDPRMPYTAPQLDARYAQRVNVIEKGTATPYTPAGPNDPLNKGYGDTTYIAVLAKGFNVLGNADPSGGTTHTISFGKTLPSAFYKVDFSIESNSVNPANDTYYTPVIRNKTTTSFDMYFREASGAAQNITVAWSAVPE